MKNFNIKIREWLLPIEYVEVYRINHPSAIDNEVHFSKDGIRVICVKNKNEEYCYLHMDVIMDPYPLAIKTGKFLIGFAELGKIHHFVKCKGSYIK